jgi:hypothetical protein
MWIKSRATPHRSWFTPPLDYLSESALASLVGFERVDGDEPQGDGALRAQRAAAVRLPCSAISN